MLSYLMMIENRKIKKLYALPNLSSPKTDFFFIKKGCFLSFFFDNDRKQQDLEALCVS